MSLKRYEGAHEETCEPAGVVAFVDDSRAAVRDSCICYQRRRNGVARTDVLGPNNPAQANVLVALIDLDPLFALHHEVAVGENTRDLHGNGALQAIALVAAALAFEGTAGLQINAEVVAAVNGDWRAKDRWIGNARAVVFAHIRIGALGGRGRLRELHADDVANFHCSNVRKERNVTLLQIQATGRWCRRDDRLGVLDRLDRNVFRVALGLDAPAATKERGNAETRRNHGEASAIISVLSQIHDHRLQVVGHVLEHLIGGGDRSRIHFISALRLNHIDQLLNHIHVRAFDISLGQSA